LQAATLARTRNAGAMRMGVNLWETARRREAAGASRTE
jgi:hypothetical protein